MTTMANVSEEVIDVIDLNSKDELNFDNLYPVLLQTFVVIVLG